MRRKKRIIMAVILILFLNVCPELLWAADGQGQATGPALEIWQKQVEEEAREEEGQGEEEMDPEEPVLLYTEEDLEVMAHVLAGECQNCPDEEQLYVGSVVLNRRAHPSFPDSIREVVFQRGQYSCTRDGNYDRLPTERNYANARRLLEEGSVLPPSVIWQSGGRQGNGVYLKTRWHYYCY